MSEHIDKYLSMASQHGTEEGSNFVILKDVLKAVPSPEFIRDTISAIEEYDMDDNMIEPLQKQLDESEKIYKKFAHILMRK